METQSGKAATKIGTDCWTTKFTKIGRKRKSY